MTNKQLTAMFGYGACQEKQAEAFLYYKRKMIRKNITKRKETRLHQLHTASSASASASAAMMNADMSCGYAYAYNPVLVPAPSGSDSDDHQDASPPLPSTPDRKFSCKRHRPSTLQNAVDLTEPRPQPSTLEHLLAGLQSDRDALALDPPDCQSKECPYCTGEIMSQRHALAVRLVQIEQSIYAKQSHIHLL